MNDMIVEYFAGCAATFVVAAFNNIDAMNDLGSAMSWRRAITLVVVQFGAEPIVDWLILVMLFKVGFNFKVVEDIFDPFYVAAVVVLCLGPFFEFFLCHMRRA